MCDRITDPRQQMYDFFNANTLAVTITKIVKSTRVLHFVKRGLSYTPSIPPINLGIYATAVIYSYNKYALLSADRTARFSRK